MMDCILDIQGPQKITWTKELLLIPGFDTMSELKFNVMDGDKDGRKRYYMDKVIKYIILMYKYNSPLSEMSEDQRHSNALRYVQLPDDWKPDEPRIQQAIKEFKLINDSTRELVLFKNVTANLEAAMSHINDVDYDKLDKLGKPIYDITKYIRAGNELLDTKDRYLKYKKELQTSAKASGAAGNRDKRMFEDRR
jgi:hypothetical protein